jgi:UDP-N-acetylmuramoylalanine--D-glutamate ligase
MSAVAPTGAGPALRYLIVGFGVTGQAVGGWARARGERAVVVEDRPGPDTAAIADRLGVELALRPGPGELAALLEGVDVIVPSPGVPVSHDVYALAAAAARPVRSEIELAWWALEARATPRPVLAAVTGTNGKTTVTALVAEMLRASGRRAVTGGNIGRPLIDAVGLDADVVVAEVSSFQLQFTERFRPRVSCWLNLSADHLDWHPDLAHYAAAKARVWANQGPGDTAVFNVDDRGVSDYAAALPAGVTPVGFALSASGPGGHAGYRVVGDHLFGEGEGELAKVAELPRHLPHDLTNSLAAAAVASACGATAEGIRRALRTTLPPAHRVELVGEGSGVRWYDDSKATTPASVLAAVAGFPSVVLIAGGRNKGLDLTALAATVPPVRAVVAIGESAGEIERAFGDRVPVRHASSMEEAVESAGAMAAVGDSVVLSPGCASFDWYRSYAARGDHFAAIVRDRLEKGFP